jgi:hypothetical protein
LYFTGIAAANSFGPVMRFAFGARFTAQRLTKVLRKTAVRQTVAMSAVEVAVNTK